jgi:hypothetical protein
MVGKQLGYAPVRCWAGSPPSLAVERPRGSRRIGQVGSPFFISSPSMSRSRRAVARHQCERGLSRLGRGPPRCECAPGAVAGRWARAANWARSAPSQQATLLSARAAGMSSRRRSSDGGRIAVRAPLGVQRCSGAARALDV